MESIVHSALEEICYEATNGLYLQNLWPRLRSSLAARGLPLCPNVKRVVWENLVEVPGLRFEACDGVVSVEDLMKCSVEECDHVKIVAPEAMRKSFLGIYDIEASKYSLSDTRRLVLERLAVARTNGIAQNDLTKQLRIQQTIYFTNLNRVKFGSLEFISAIMEFAASSLDGACFDRVPFTNNRRNLARGFAAENALL